MYRKSLSNLLGGSLLVASIAAACGGDAGTGEGALSAGTGAPSTPGAGTPATGAAGKPAGSAGSTAAAAGNKATAGTPSTPSGAAGKPAGSAGSTAAAGSGPTAAAGSGPSAAAGSGTAAAGSGPSAAAGSGAAGGGAAGGAAPGGTLGGPLKYTGPFTMGMMIPEKHKCPSMGDNVSPPLAWTGGPADTKSFAIVLFDTTYMMLHWAIWDIPATVNSLPEGLGEGYELANPMGAHQAANMCMMTPAYCGPCSGGGGFIAAGTYEYRLYALKVDKLGLMESSSASAAQSAIESMMLEKAVWAGKPPE